jgi:hypothetical protein
LCQSRVALLRGRHERPAFGLDSFRMAAQIRVDAKSPEVLA